MSTNDKPSVQECFRLGAGNYGVGLMKARAAQADLSDPLPLTPRGNAQITAAANRIGQREGIAYAVALKKLTEAMAGRGNLAELLRPGTQKPAAPVVVPIRQVTVAKAAPVVPFPARPAPTPTPTGSPLAHLRSVLASITRRTNGSTLANVTEAQAAELNRLADWLDHNERHGAGELRAMAQGKDDSGALRFSTVQRVLGDVDFALAPPKDAA